MNQFESRKPAGLKEYDYSTAGWYFVTVCSKKNKENIFGEYKNTVVGEGLASSRNNIKLSKIGKIIDNQWNNIKIQYSNIELDQYIVMPNHIHGILIINKRGSKREDARPSPTVSDIVCAFKSKCTVEYVKYIEQNSLDVSGKIWQRSFHDHIIRVTESLNSIREYIVNNSANWNTDENNIKNKSNYNNPLNLTFFTTRKKQVSSSVNLTVAKVNILRR